MGSRFLITAPRDYVLARDVCSYGYFLLAPNHWIPATRSFVRPLDLAEGPATLVVAQPEGKAGAALSVGADRALSRRERAQATALLTRMLRLDEDLTEFHRLDPRWRASGRGRLFRSPTFYEDVVKTVTSCNVTWPGTRRMNERLCAVINPAFPRAEQVARRRAQSLRARCSVGYRDARLVELSRMFVSGEVDGAWFEDMSRTDDEVYKALLALPGVGPYGAANIMQLLGRYSRLALDTESVRHGRAALGLTGEAREVEKAVKAHYESFGAHRFRSYWLELWDHYEKLKGPAWEWDREETGSSFTAAEFAKAEVSKARGAGGAPARRQRGGRSRS